MQLPTTSKRVLLFGSISLVAILLVLLYSNNSTNVLKSKSEIDENPVIHKVSYNNDYAVAGDVEGLVGLSDYVVVGQYGKFEKQWDMGEKYFSEVFTFNIEEVLQGDISGTINVAIPHYQEAKVSLESKDYTTNVELQNYNEPKIGEKYILFLKYYEPTNTYTPASVPFQILVKNDGTAELLTNDDSGIETIKVSNKEFIEVDFERTDVKTIDKVSGLKEKEIKESIISSVKNKIKN